ncbi:MAG: DUF2341 domain-containing protein [Methanogenium sp.]|jgi:hypothetical protein
MSDYVIPGLGIVNLEFDGKSVVMPEGGILTSPVWLDGFTYRKKFTISRSSGLVTNYQMKLLVGESSGSSGAEVHCEGHCLSNFNDLRFTSYDGITVFDYWIESIYGTTPNQTATIWIEFPSINTSFAPFYMYYGNSDASEYSNGENTFPFFDHFNTESMDTNKWYHWYTNGSTSLSNSILSLVGGSGTYNYWGGKTQFGINHAFRSRGYITIDGSANDACIFGVDDRSATGSPIGAGADLAFFHITGGAKRYSWYKNGSAYYDSRADAIQSFSLLEIRRNSTTNVKCYIGDVLKETISSNVPSSDNMGACLYSNYASHTIYWDWVLVRKYEETEPAWGSWYSEESLEEAVSQNYGGMFLIFV